MCDSIKWNRGRYDKESWFEPHQGDACGEEEDQQMARRAAECESCNCQ